MAVRESRRTRRKDDEDTRDQWAETEDSDEPGRDGDGSSSDRQADRAPARRPSERHRDVSGEVFDPKRAIPVGRLRLARHWSETGRDYQAIHAFTQVLIRYPGTGAADAAVEELMLMADKLTRQGRFYAALNIFNKLDDLC